MPAEIRSSGAITKRNLILAHTVKSPILTDTQRLNKEIMLALKEPAVASSGRPPFMDAIDGCFLSRASSGATCACIHNA
ncbi:hypothetical protein D2T32_17085 [Sinirhodobacter populi]|nr:hypothetical protein D2T32_17085 [Sinirhodobacter populi]